MFNPDYFKAALVSADESGISPYFIYAQWCHETADFTSDLCLDYNNLGGITQVSVNDLPQPDGDFYYRKFDSVSDFGAYFGRYLLLLDGIANCDTLSAYVTCLNFNGYFGAAYSDYLAACSYWYELYYEEMVNYVNAQTFA